MERRYFRVGLSVDFKKEVNLLPKWFGIQKLAEEFSSSYSYKREIRILDLTDNIMYLLIGAFTECKYPANRMLRLISSFLKSICSFYGVEYNSRKHYFTIDEVIETDFEEFKKLSTNGAENLAYYISNDELEGNEEAEENLDKQFEEEMEEYPSENSEGEVKELLIPKRQFPYLSNGTARINSSERKDNEEFKSYKEVLNKLDSLVGMGQVKGKIKQIANFIIQNNERYVKLNIENPGLYYNFVISGGRGTGKDTIIKLIYQLLYQLGVIGNGKLIYVDSRDIWPGNTLDRNIGNAQSGVVVINDVQVIDVNDKRGQKDYQGTFDNWFTQYKENFIFIVAGEPGGIKNIMSQNKVSKHINFQLHIPEYSDEEILELISFFAKKEKYKIAAEAHKVILENIRYYKETNSFENVYTARSIVEKAFIKKSLRGHSDILDAEDFMLEEVTKRKEIKSEEVIIEKDPFEELRNMIGLEEVKQRVEEISAFAAAQVKRKELGLEKESMCLHMNFSGAPGTGKTTVARIIGRIFKNLGVLSKGHFVEVAREDLVGKYVGHTAAKTSEKIMEAKGGVLFVDEAFSLASESRIDYGYEAISTLVKKMEDLREDIVVIFAGYNKEMKELMKMNPGLKDRIQFKVEFNDYKTSELVEIWTKFFEDNNYSIGDNALVEMNNIAHILYESKSINFANGRVMRKCFERVRMHQAMRLMKAKCTTIEDLMNIIVEDIRCLYNDRDIMPEIKTMQSKKCIGFI